MALIAETGAGVANADAYELMPFFDAYMLARGRTEWAEANEAAIREPAVRRGTRAIDILFADRWPGQRTYGRAQARAWPRSNVVTTEGIDLEPDEIPIELKEATAEAAWLEFNEEGVLMPTPSGQLEKAITIGPISVDFGEQRGSASELQLAVHMPLFEKLLWNLITTATTQMRWLGRV